MTRGTQRFLPSYRAAFLFGALGLPLNIWGSRFLDAAPLHDLLQVLWLVTSIFVPFVLATLDREWARAHSPSRWRHVPLTRESLHHLYVPAWKRTFVFWGAGLVAELALEWAGVALG